MSFTRFLINLREGSFFKKEPGSVAKLLTALITAPLFILVNTLKNLPGTLWQRWDKGLKRKIGITLAIFSMPFAPIAKGLYYPLQYVLFPIIQGLMILPAILLNLLYSAIVTLAKKSSIESRTYNIWSQKLITFSLFAKHSRPDTTDRFLKKSLKTSLHANITDVKPQIYSPNLNRSEEATEKWYDALNTMPKEYIATPSYSYS